MSVRTVGRLEGKMAGLGVCPVCRGLGRPAFRVEWAKDIPLPPGDGDGAAGGAGGAGAPRPPRPEPEGCPRCGEVRLTIIRVVYDDRPPGSTLHDRRW